MFNHSVNIALTDHKSFLKQTVFGRVKGTLGIVAVNLIKSLIYNVLTLVISDVNSSFNLLQVLITFNVITSQTS